MIEFALKGVPEHQIKIRCSGMPGSKGKHITQGGFICDSNRSHNQCRQRNDVELKVCWTILHAYPVRKEEVW